MLGNEVGSSLALVILAFAHNLFTSTGLVSTYLVMKKRRMLYIIGKGQTDFAAQSILFRVVRSNIHRNNGRRTVLPTSFIGRGAISIGKGAHDVTKARSRLHGAISAKDAPKMIYPYGIALCLQSLNTQGFTIFELYQSLVRCLYCSVSRVSLHISLGRPFAYST